MYFFIFVSPYDLSFFAEGGKGEGACDCFADRQVFGGVSAADNDFFLAGGFVDRTRSPIAAVIIWNLILPLPQPLVI